MRRARQIVVAVAVAALCLGQAIPAQASVVVRAKCNFYDPKSVSIHHGTRVVWRGACGTPTVTAYGGNWSKDVTISKGETTGKTFKKAGTFKFRCTFHSSLSNGVCSGMCGKVR